MDMLQDVFPWVSFLMAKLAVEKTVVWFICKFKYIFRGTCFPGSCCCIRSTRGRLENIVSSSAPPSLEGFDDGVDKDEDQDSRWPV